MRISSLFIFCFLISPAIAGDMANGMSSSHALGQQLAQGLQGSIQGTARGTSASIVPGYVTDKPPQTSLNDGNLEAAAKAEQSRSEVGRFLKSVSETRQKFVLDPDTDPLLKNGEAVLRDPHTILDVKLEQGAEEKGEVVTLICEEAGDSSEHTCYLNLVPGKKIRRERIYVNSRYHGYGRHGGSIGYFSEHVNVPHLPGNSSWQEGVNVHHHSYTHNFRYEKSLVFINEDLSETRGAPEEITEEEYDSSPQEEELSQKDC
jgi:hypothetical protein